VDCFRFVCIGGRGFCSVETSGSATVSAYNKDCSKYVVSLCLRRLLLLDFCERTWFDDQISPTSYWM
jgi:hypothetical protein